MNFKYGVMPETFKLAGGNYWLSNTDQLGGYPKEISLYAAKNDTAAFQLVLGADADFILNLSRVQEFSQKGMLPSVRLEAGGELDCRLNLLDMRLDDGNVYRADALLSYPSAELKKDEVRAVFCEISVPSDLKAGKYALTVRVLESEGFSDERETGEVKISLEVADYTMPDVRENKFHLDLWQHSCNIARKCETEPWSDEHFAALENYVRSLGELGQKAATLIVTDVPWAGQGCFNEYRTKANLFEYAIVSTVKHPDGSFECDYSKLQRYIDLCAKYGIDREISVYGICGIWKSPEKGFAQLADDYCDAVRIRYYDEADGAFKYMRKAADIDVFVSSLEKYFLATGQMDKVRIAADEPNDIEAYRATLKHLKAVAPSFKFKAAINHAEFVSEFGDEVYDFVPCFDSMCQKYPELSRYKATMKGKRFLYYVCCGPNFPNTFLSSALVESLYLGVIASYAGFDGFLRWNYTVWNDDPRDDIRYGTWKAGDTNFVYPQKNGAPLLTLRYKELKRGIQLYELLEKLRETGDAEALDTAYGYVIRERDITKCSGRASFDELGSTEAGDYFAMKKFIIEKLISK